MVRKLLGLAVMGGLGYAFLGGRGRRKNAAYAEGQPHDSHMDVRDAGPEAMRDQCARPWDETDEDGDESFPASDPPGGY